MNTSEENSATSHAPRIIVVGGFLGAGKTTSIIRLASLLKKLGRTVAVVSTAAGGESVDSIRLRHLGIAMEEARGWFPREAVVQAADRLRSTAPHFVFVESPGATLPVNAGTTWRGFSAAPVTVLLDTHRALKMLGLEPGNAFSDPIAYLYRKQIEHGSLLVINRADVVAPRKLASLRQALARHAPTANVLELGRSDHAGLDEWLQCLSKDPPEMAIPESDAGILAQAERSLAALNSAVNLSTVKYFEGDKVLLNIAALTQHILRQESVEIAHLKMILQATDGAEGYASVSTSGNDIAPELTGSFSEPIQNGRMVLNLRAEVDPGLLNSAVNRALLAIVDKFPELFARMEYCEHFRPETNAVAA